MERGENGEVYFTTEVLHSERLVILAAVAKVVGLLANAFYQTKYFKRNTYGRQQEKACRLTTQLEDQKTVTDTPDNCFCLKIFLVSTHICKNSHKLYRGVLSVRCMVYCT